MKSPARNSPNNTDAFSHAAPLPISFYTRDTVSVARDLLGKALVVRNRNVWLAAEIIEVEAYLADDPASHSFRGPTPRNSAMFEVGGTCYVYLCYGINYCVNVVTGPKGRGEAILLRAAAPLLGIEKMRDFRKTENEKHLLSGPGKLAQGFGLDLKENGRSFLDEGLKMVDLGKSYSTKEIASSRRIGISRAKNLELRFSVKNASGLSRKN